MALKYCRKSATRCEPFKNNTGQTDQENQKTQNRKPNNNGCLRANNS